MQFRFSIYERLIFCFDNLFQKLFFLFSNPPFLKNSLSNFFAQPISPISLPKLWLNYNQSISHFRNKEIVSSSEGEYAPLWDPSTLKLFQIL